jgi:hypothetical protein
MPFETFRAAEISRQMNAAIFYAANWDKIPIRCLARQLGVPDDIAFRAKDPFQRSSGMLTLLDERMREDVTRHCPDQLSAKYNAQEDPFIALRYYVALLSKACSQ